MGAAEGKNQEMKNIRDLRENVKTADRKPEIYTDPEGKKRVRMVSTDREIVKEAEMTDAQKKKREEIVLKMKDKEDEFKKNYGDRWKEVMYATATKMAMKESAGHYMYKDGKKVWVKTAADHDKYAAKGYTMKEEVELDEKVYASDYNVGHEKSKFGGYRPHVTHKKTGKTMYLGQTSYKKPEHAKGHADAYLKGYEKMNDRTANRMANEYEKANKQHLYKEENVTIVNEAKDQSTDRLKMLVRLGLMDKKDMAKIVRSIGKMKEDKPVSPADRKILFDLLNELIGMITGDEQMFQKAKKAVREEKDPNEYDREGDMLKNQLRQICSANEKLMKMVGDNDNLPEWVQNKVTKATDYITSVRDYLESEKNEQVHEKVKVDELSRGTLINYSVKSRGDALKHSRLFKGAKTTAQDDERVKKRMRGDALAGKKLDRLDKKLGESKEKYIVIHKKSKKPATKEMSMQMALDAYDSMGGNAKGLAVVKASSIKQQEQKQRRPSFNDITDRKPLSKELARKIVRDSETAIDRMLAKKKKKNKK